MQIVGGHCVVITSHWHGNRPAAAPRTEQELEENLNFAHAVYQQLKRAAADAAANAKAAAKHGQREPLTQMAEADRAAPRPAPPRRRRPRSWLGKLCLFGSGVPLLLIGLLMTIGLVGQLRRGWASADWPRADGRIVVSELDVVTRQRGDREIHRYKPRVRFEYEVAGAPYRGERIQYGAFSRTEDRAAVAEVLAKYPLHQAVQVHYDQDRPQSAVLEPGVQEESTLVAATCGAGVACLMGLFLISRGCIGKRVPPAQ